MSEASPEEVFYAKGFLASKGCPTWATDLVDEYASEALTMSPEQIAAEIRDILTQTPNLRPAGPAILHDALSAAAMAASPLLSPLLPPAPAGGDGIAFSLAIASQTQMIAPIVSTRALSAARSHSAEKHAET